MIAQSLFEPGIRTAEMDPRLALWGLLPEEDRIVARAVGRRRREFTAGRRCARRAMTALSHPAAPIGQNTDRSPVWPAGLIGSISHTESWCVAAVARKGDGFRAIGLDIEPAEALPDGLAPSICRAEELDWLDHLPSADRGLSARALFSAKECVFKLQFALTGAMLDFEAVSVRIDWRRSTFAATFTTGAAPFAPGDELHGRIAIRHGHIGCGAALTDAWRGARAWRRTEPLRPQVERADFLESGATP